MPRSADLRCVLMLLPGLAGCSVLEGPPTHLAVTLEAADRLNPDAGGLAMPVQVQVYTLRSVSKFDGSDYFTVIDPDKHALEGETIAQQEAVIRPGKSQTFKFSVSLDAKYVGVVASFELIDRAVWHASLPIPDTGKVSGTLSGDTVTLRAHD